MAEHFSFFDAVLEEDGVTYDREYNAQQFTKYFGALVTTGVMKGMGNMLAVSANGSNMVTKINTGVAFVEGKYYENDSFKELTHDTETLGNSRIDRIVIRMDLATEARYVKTFIKKGVPSINPVAPSLTQTPNLYEISLAQVKIVGGQTFIATNAITDERGKDVICPWAGSNILPNFDDVALDEHINGILHTPYVISTGTNSVYNVDLGPNVTELVEGLSFSMKPHVTCIGGPRISVNGLPPVYILKPNQSLMLDAEMQANMIVTLVYNGQYFIAQGVLPVNAQKIAVTPWSGWLHDSTYNIAVQKIDGKMVRVFGFIKKTSTSGVILCVIPEGYRPTVERVPFLMIVPNTSGAYTTITKTYLTSANGYIMFDNAEFSSLKNDFYIYFDFSYSIV